MISAVLIGSGNLAYQLHRALHSAAGIDLVQLASRNPKALAGFDPGIPRAQNLGSLKQADIFILAVADRAIGELAAKLSVGNALLVHTSGAQPLEALAPVRRCGVFYPLQSYSRNRDLGFEGVPILLESRQPEDLELLNGLCSALKGRPVVADSRQRLAAHLSAVFTNNFTNHLAHLAGELCEVNGLDPEILRPLLLETVHKLGSLTPYEAQTGPARRRDLSTLERHREMLHDPLLLNLYNQLTLSIQRTYEAEL